MAVWECKRDWCGRARMGWGLQGIGGCRKLPEWLQVAWRCAKGRHDNLCVGGYLGGYFRASHNKSLGVAAGVCKYVCEGGRAEGDHCRMWESYQNNFQSSLLASPMTLFFGKPTGKVANGNHVIVGHCNHCKCKIVAEHPDHDYMVVWGCWDNWNFEDQSLTVAL